MKKVVLSICIAILALLPTVGFAHVLKTDGSIGAVLHVDPADDPEVGKPATFFFEFKDKQNNFSLQKCDCAVSIVKGGREVYSGTLSGAGGLESPLFQYTFTERGIYTVKASGSPRIADNFQNFSLSWDVRVDKGDGSVPATESSGGGHTLHFILLGGAFVVIFGKYAFDVYKNKKSAGKQSGRHIATGFFVLFAILGLLFHQVHTAMAGCAGDISPAAHECCLPVLANTASDVQEYYIVVNSEVVETATTFVEAESVEVFNNKSPPVA